MAYKEKGISANIETIVALDKQETKTIEGIYKEYRSFGESGSAHIFEVNGKLEGVWASYDLNDKLKGEEGKKVRVTYLETQKLKGGRTYKVFKVEVDE